MSRALAHMLAGLVVTVTACGSVQTAHAQAPEKERRHALGINPIKLFTGLANVEYERRSAHHLGLHVFAEYQVFQWFEHPDLVVRAGLQYYPAPEPQDLRGLFAGLNVGVSRSTNDPRPDEGVFVGSGFGARFVFNDRFYVSPRLVLHFLIAEKKLLWGFEAPVGILF